jgi:hypothetical protein
MFDAVTTEMEVVVTAAAAVTVAVVITALWFLQSFCFGPYCDC